MYERIKLTIFLILFTLILAETNEDIKNTKMNLNQEKKGIFKMFEAFTTIFLSGLFDRSFFITAFMAVKYSKLLVLTSASLALSLVGILSVFLGLAITTYIPPLWIDIFAIVLFLFFGIKMLIESYNIPKNKDLIKLQEEHEKLLVKEVTNTSKPHPSHNHNLVDVQKECEDLKMENSNLKVFFKIFILIFASEIGDRSQISTIYLTSNYDKLIVIASSVLAQNVLTLIAIFGGVLISKSISDKNLTLIAGFTFIVFGFWALTSLCISDIFVLGKTPSSISISEETIPEKSLIIPN